MIDEHLALDLDVEARRRLVEHDERRVDGERHREQHALDLPAAQLMRVAAQERGVGRERDPAEVVGDALLQLREPWM